MINRQIAHNNQAKSSNGGVVSKVKAQQVKETPTENSAGVKLKQMDLAALNQLIREEEQEEASEQPRPRVELSAAELKAHKDIGNILAQNDAFTKMPYYVFQAYVRQKAVRR